MIGLLCCSEPEVRKTPGQQEGMGEQSCSLHGSQEAEANRRISGKCILFRDAAQAIFFLQPGLLPSHIPYDSTQEAFIN